MQGKGLGIDMSAGIWLKMVKYPKYNYKLCLNNGGLFERNVQILEQVLICDYTNSNVCGCGLFNTNIF